VKARLHDALGRSRAGFTEVRVRRVWSSSVLVRDRATESASSAVETGGMVRCCSPKTGWGIVGFGGLDHLDGQVLRAHELSLAAGSRLPVALAPVPVRQLDSIIAIADDPREVSLAEKRQHAESVAELTRGGDRRITSTRVLRQDRVVETWLATSEGSWLHDLRSEVSLSVLAIATEGGNLERAMGSFRVTGGWASETRLDERFLNTGLRAVERLNAAPVRPGRYPVVLDPAAAGLLIHRAVTHLARPSLPGADSDELPLGTRIGPEFLTVGDDPTALGLAGSMVTDDEGTEARRSVVLQNGVMVSHLHSRETAARARQAPTGHARAGSLRGAPYPRAANSFLASGQGTLEDLLSGIELGVYLADALTCEWAGDRLSLQAGQARMVRNGRLAEPVKGAGVSGSLLGLLGKVDAIAGDFIWDQGGGRCRDGSAGSVPVATGAPHVRLLDAAVGQGTV
jgi:TldD protein